MDTVIRLERNVQAMFKELLKENLPVTPVTKSLIHSLFHVSTNLDVLSSQMTAGGASDVNAVQAALEDLAASLQNLESEAFAVEHVVPFRFLKLISVVKNEMASINIEQFGRNTY